MRSMTGFGKGEALSSDGRILFRAEVSSVNRKQLEVKLNLPREMAFCEYEVRRLTSERISRGSLSMRVEMVFQDENAAVSRINMSSLSALVRQIRELRKECDLSEDVNVEQLLCVPGVLSCGDMDYEEPNLVNALKQACGAALDELVKMRQTEGDNLKKVLEGQLAFLSSNVDEIEPLVKTLPQMQYEKLLKRLEEQELSSVDRSDERLLRELVIYSDRSDVTEEITRLRSHFAHLASFLQESKEALGRNMDFLMQEIFREINTLGNKAPIPEVSARVVRMKTEVEKIREQVQNIE